MLTTNLSEYAYLKSEGATSSLRICMCLFVRLHAAQYPLSLSRIYRIILREKKFIRIEKLRLSFSISYALGKIGCVFCTTYAVLNIK